MSLRPVFSTVAAAAGRRSSHLVLSRHYAAYPFTRDTTTQPNAVTKAKAQYPFTRPEITQEAAPMADTDKPTVVESTGTGVDAAQHADLPRQPDYNVAADYRSSHFSPIPLRVMDGSEDTDVTAAAVLSGAPTELQARTVRIFKPAKTATQSGDWHGHHWRMDWDILEKGHRWENPLMGWQSSGDFMQGTHMNFVSKEDAIRFAQKQGYEYYVQEPNVRRVIPKAYATQFVHSAKTLKEVRTK